MKCLFGGEVVSEYMRLHFASENVALDNKLKPWEVLPFEKVANELNKKGTT